MVRQRYDLGEWSNAGGGDRPTDAARDRLNEAVKELRRLTEDQLFQAVERLSDVEDIYRCRKRQCRERSQDPAMERRVLASCG